MKLYRNVVERTNSPEVLNANYILQKKQSSLNIFEYRQTELNYEGQNMKKWLFTSNLYKVTVLTIPKNSWKTSVVQCSLSNRTWRPGKKIYVRIFPDFHDSYSQSNSSQLPLNIIFSTKLRCYTYFLVSCATVTEKHPTKLENDRKVKLLQEILLNYRNFSILIICTRC